MNRSMILYVVGHVVMLEGVMLLLPCLVSLIYQDRYSIELDSTEYIWCTSNVHIRRYPIFHRCVI